jgi:hypothetical protein
LAVNFRLAVNMFQLIYALKKHNNWRFQTPPQPRISFERAIFNDKFGIFFSRETVATSWSQTKILLLDNQMQKSAILYLLRKLSKMYFNVS